MNVNSGSSAMCYRIPASGYLKSEQNQLTCRLASGVGLILSTLLYWCVTFSVYSVTPFLKMEISR